jgi:hypothetical protein
MKYLNFFLFVFLFDFNISHPQQNPHVLDDALRFRGLNRNDITIPLDFFNTAEKSPTASTKLILPITARLLNNPLQSFAWIDSIGGWNDSDLTYQVFKMHQMSYLYDKPEIYNFRYIHYRPLENSKDFSFNEMLRGLKRYKDILKKLFTNYSSEEINFLKLNLFSLFEESDKDDPSNYDIFKFNKARDSSIAVSKKTMDLLNKLDKKDIYLSSAIAFGCLYELYFYLKDKNKNYEKQLIKELEIETENDSFLYVFTKDKLKIAIGGKGNNVYKGRFNLIIDFGGDDVYEIENNDPMNNGFSCIIDLSGNDYYTTSNNFALAGGLFSSSFIFDKEGDDAYESRGSGNFGAAIGGLGLLYDENGNDTYRSVSFSLGAGCFGVGLLVDKNGNDVYIANSYSQGFGMTQGVGAIIDSKGNDSYLVDARSLDIGRYNDHYVSMCQGFGLGLRPYYAGGVGLIIEDEGNDIYSTDIFGQGSGYWYSVGAIIDKSGHDKYNSYQYAQGSGVHIAVGLLNDEDGWDFYTSNGVSQGCGHDYAFGLLWDVKGNDNYSAYSLSQGAGNANGIGLLFDESGRDGYLNKEPLNTQGYGNPRREFGSLGIFIDASGTDFYSMTGLDSTIGNSSLWGVFSDYTAADLPEQESGDNFKVPVDSINRPHDIPFTTAEFYIMAKTIEPRFSLWQEYGFRHLITDSINTAYYAMSQLGTDDHRVVQVMRVLILKIPYAISDAIINKINTEKEKLTTDELSMICYLAGESKNPILKDILYDLTFNESRRVRSTAINALGKLKINTSDVEFISKVSERLNELVNDGTATKLMNKDIAFTFKNYMQEGNISSIIKLLQSDYYGARFVAADALKQFGDLYSKYADDSFIINIKQDKVILYSFLNSLQGLSDAEFINIINRLDTSVTDEIDKLKFAEVIKIRISTTKNENTKLWCNERIKVLEEGNILKLK